MAKTSTGAGEGADAERVLAGVHERALAVVALHADTTPSSCPTCGASDWVRDGHAARRRGEPVQVFRCRECGKKRVGHSDSPFRHPLFPADVMVAAVLLRRAGWGLQQIASNVSAADAEGVARSPNRQTVGRWLKRLTPVVEAALEILDDRARVAEAAGTPSPAAELERVDPSPPQAAAAPVVGVRPAPPGVAPDVPGPAPPPADDSLDARFTVLKTIVGDRTEGVHVVRDNWHPRGSTLILKVLRSMPAAGAVESDVQTEFRLRARLRHPNVVRVRDFGVLADKRHWFTQDQVEGLDLYDAARDARFDDVLDWMVGVLRGCAYVHGRGILHRDLKPENVMVGQDRVPRIVDFGISVRHGDDDERGASGSLGYLAPEVLAGEPADASVDLYAVAVAIHHVLRRELPDPSGSQPALSTVRSDVPAWFDAVLARMCAVDRADRYPSAAAVIEAITKRSGIRFAQETPRTLAARVSGAAFIGRDEELARIEAAFADGSTVSGVVVSGPPGIGKSRLLEAWRHGQQLGGGQVVEGPVATVLRAAARRLGPTHPLVRRYEDVIHRLTGGVAELPMPLRPRDGILRDRDAVLQLIAAGHPREAVILIDDVDRVDEPTLAVLDALVTRGPGRVRLLMAAREPDASDVLAQWVAAGAVSEVRLGPLDEESVASMIAEAFDGSLLAEELAPRVARATDGNPRFVEEVLRALVERGEVRCDDTAQWRAGESGELPVPRQLVDASRARLQALSEPQRKLTLQLAAAGAAVPRAAVDVLAERDTSEALLSRALIRVVGGGLAIGHDALREAAVGGLESSACRRIRREVAAAVEECVPAGERPSDLLARLWTAAGETARAVPYLAACAQGASERWDVREALGWLEQLDLLLSAEGGPPDVVAPGLREQTLRELVRMLRYRGRHEEQSVALDRLSLLAQMEGDTALLHETAALKALFWFDRGRYALVRQLCNGHLPAARDLAEPTAIARFQWVLGMAACAEGRIEEGLSLSDRVLEVLGDSVDPEALDLRVQAQINRGNAFGQVGRLDRAVSAFERALALCRQHGLNSSAIVCTMNLGICHAMQCRYGPALEHFDRARTEAQRLGWRDLGDVLQANQAEVERNLGLWTVAADRAEALIGEGREPHVLLSARCTLASCRAALGDTRGATSLVADALDASKRSGGVKGARLWLTEAEVRLAEGVQEGVEAAAAALERVVEGPAGPHEAALAATRLARIALEEGVEERALELINLARERSEQGPREVREGLVEVLYVRARVLLALGEMEEAGRALEKAVEELGRECVELDGGPREAFLGIDLHRELVDEAKRLLGRVPGFAAPSSPAGEGLGAELQDVKEVLQVTRKLSRAPGLAAAIDVALDAVLRRLPAERAWLLAADGGVYAPLGGRRAGRAPLEPSGGQPPEQLLTAMARLRRPVSEHEARGSSRRSPDGDGESFRELAVPLCYGDTVVGAIYVASDELVDPLSDHERFVLEALAEQAALAVQHYLQVEEIERLRRRTHADLTRTRARLAQEAVLREQAERAVEAERRQVKLRHSYDQIVHTSAAMREVLATVDRVVDRKITVLVNGESGTGKELIARALHYNGPRRDGPFVAINCGAIPANLIESELFGHVRGAFTGAVKDRRGHFELAHRGTLFLDELGEIATDVQVRLLRVLETGEVTPVGSSRRIKVDVRIVTATNRDLVAEVAAGRFREDLYYRINAVTILLPPLRERPEDLPLLLDHFATSIGADRGEPVKTFGPGIRARLMRHTWPGNVRELRNVVEYATLFADEGHVPEDLALPF